MSWDWFAKLSELRGAGTPSVLVTVSRVSGSTPREAGAKLIVLASGEFFGSIGGGRLEELAISDARDCLSLGRTAQRRYPLAARAGQCCGGMVELLMEVLDAGPRLYLFGAGHVAQALCRVMLGTPFTVHAIDPRPEWIARLPHGVVGHALEWDEFLRTATWSEQSTYVAIMTHRHELDQEIVAATSARPSRFVGLIGSQEKWRRFRERLEARGIAAAQLARVACPIGQARLGKAPQEIAISVAAQLLSLHYQAQHAQTLDDRPRP